MAVHITNSERRAIEAARAWIGTPYILGAALRGVGCDCVGLVRGVWSDLTGCPVPPAPPWRNDWANSSARPLIAAAQQFLNPVAVDQARPGTVVVLRIDGTREAHCGILDLGGQFIHAVEDVGVVRVPFDAYKSGLSYAAHFPAQ